MRNPPDSQVRYYVHEAPSGRTLAWMAIPATGNSFRRFSLGFKTTDYVRQIGVDRNRYDLITFVRDPIQRFISVWDWMEKRVEDPKLDFMDEDPYRIDKHLRPQHTFNVLGADYIGRFETLKQDWENLQKKYSLGPFKQPPRLYGTKKWNDILTKDELLKAVSYYEKDFSAFGYDSKQYIDATPLDANRLLRENNWR